MNWSKDFLNLYFHEFLFTVYSHYKEVSSIKHNIYNFEIKLYSTYKANLFTLTYKLIFNFIFEKARNALCVHVRNVKNLWISKILDLLTFDVADPCSSFLKS